MIDLATLTGACVVALGERHAGIFSNNNEIIKMVERASKESGDKVWAMPLDEGFKDKMKSKVADLGNIGDLGRLAGASTAAAFLSNFVGETPWIHIDIAGPTKQSKDMEAWTPPSGITGFGVALLVKIILG
jgi:leucyl aminopeptidase